MIYGSTQALSIAADIGDDTDRDLIVGALKWLAHDRANLVDSLTAHRAVIIAIAPDGHGDEMCDRLDAAWPVR
ncbi:hypothetical protein [Pseudonocardia sp. 73-21]|uniref:hypothetical protein n=1 Tax=Pseudonocardia sp. 73-21 TaxID=1895809 RepID=UPI000967B5B2|nr:hypothetical protein [Pseudonocardia sp. 73-21]OJY47634.1 MAG: hypothetical protein BGP03_33415 [Pseudonocardia sp. 73-21]